MYDFAGLRTFCSLLQATKAINLMVALQEVIQAQSRLLCKCGLDDGKAVQRTKYTKTKYLEYIYKMPPPQKKKRKQNTSKH